MLQVPDVLTKRLLELADFFDGLKPELYNQNMFNYGGSRCICGWTNYHAGRPELTDMDAACDTLGITSEVGNRLFSSSGGSKVVVRKGIFARWFGTTKVIPPTPQDAARCLRHLAVTGEVPADW